jgi:DNA-binding LacI/PurR family transcriptional regulator
MSAVEQLHYHRNMHARRLAIGKSELFGLVISEIANPFFSEIIRGFQSVAWDRVFDVLPLNTEYSQERTESVLRKLIENDVRGVAIMTSSFDPALVEQLTNEGIAVVLNNLPASERLISIDDISFAFLVRPPLTTIRVPREQLGSCLSKRSIACCSSSEIAVQTISWSQTL